MNAFTVVVLCLAVATVSAGHLGLGFGGFHGGWAGGWGGPGHLGHAGFIAPVNPAAHIPSGSVSVGANGVVVAGPAGSVHTNNGLHGHGAGAQLSGPAGDVRTHGGHAALSGPGIGGHGGLGYGHGGVVAAPVAVGIGAWGPGAGWGGHGWAGHGLLGGHGHGW